MNSKNQKGQAILESLITHVILLFLCFVVIEISRLLAFKSVLQAMVFDLAQQISFSHLELKRNNIISHQSSQNKNSHSNIQYYTENISQKVAQSLKNFETSLVSFDMRNDQDKKSVLSLVEHKPRVYLSFEEKKGVFIKVNACLPVLFSGYFRFFSKSKIDPIEIGKKVNEKTDRESTRNCLGEYNFNNNAVPLFWFPLQASAFMPWPASSEIYEKGVAVPKEVPALEKEHRELVSNMLEEIDLSSVFNGR